MLGGAASLGNPGYCPVVFTLREGPGSEGGARQRGRLAGEYKGEMILGHSETARKNSNPALAVA